MGRLVGAVTAIVMTLAPGCAKDAHVADRGGTTEPSGTTCNEQPFLHDGSCETPVAAPTAAAKDAPPALDAGRCLHAIGVPECAGYELCATHTPVISVNTDNCAPGPCSWKFVPDVGDTLTYENDDGWLFLRFNDYGLGGVQTTADLVSVFQHVNFFAKFPLRGSTNKAIYFESRTGPEGFDVFAFENGRLHVKLSFTITSPPYTSVVTKTTLCGDTNSCTCSFPYPEASTTFEVDLPFTRT
jgi:hypothetical protein